MGQNAALPQETSESKEFPIDVSNYSRHTNHYDAPIWWGVVGLILIELSVVSAFVVSYLYLQMMNADWPPFGLPNPPLAIPTLSLVIMLSSCITMYLSGKAIEKDEVKKFVTYTFMSVALASSVLVIRWLQFSEFDIRWDEHVYGSLLWTISGFHFMHIVSAVIGTAAIGFFGVAGFFSKQRQIGVVVDTLYWNFVAVAWIPFYFVLYWLPRLV